MSTISAEGRNLSFPVGEWHKCRRYWNLKVQCPFHPLKSEREREEREPDETEKVGRPVREPTKTAPPSKPAFKRVPRPSPLIPVGKREPIRGPGGGPPPGTPSPPIPVPLPLPIPFVPPGPLPGGPGRPLPPVVRPPAVPVGAFEFTEDDEPSMLPDGRPIMLENGLFLGDEDGDFELDDPEEEEKLTPNLGEQYVNSVIRRFNKAFQTREGLLLPRLPPALRGMIEDGDESLGVGVNSTFQDVLTTQERAYLTSLTRRRELQERPAESTRTKSPTIVGNEWSFGKRAAMAGIAGASAIGLGALGYGATRGGGGGFTSRGAVFDLSNPALAR